MSPQRYLSSNEANFLYNLSDVTHVENKNSIDSPSEQLNSARLIDKRSLIHFFASSKNSLVNSNDIKRIGFVNPFKTDSSKPSTSILQNRSGQTAKLTAY